MQKRDFIVLYQQKGASMTLIVTPTDEFSLIRALFAKEEGLTPEQANRVYSDSKLQAAAQADPATYAIWCKDAQEKQK